MARTTSWRNWSGIQRSTPEEIAIPRTEQELRELVCAVASRSMKMKAVGASHSFTGVARTDGVMVNLDQLSGVVAVNRKQMQVTFLAGTRIRDIPRLLAPHGLALANQGDVDPQSLAGAINTGTHGTGLSFTGFGGMMAHLRIVTADGQTRDVYPGDPLFNYGRIGLGAFGVVTQVTLNVVDAFLLEAREHAEPLRDVVAEFPQRCGEVDHLEYFWFPGTDVAHVKTNTRHAPGTPGLARPIPKWKACIDDEVLGNGVYGALCYAASRMPRLSPMVNKLSAANLAQRTYSEQAWKVLVAKRRVRFNEMEYAVPLADAPAILSEVHRAINACTEQVCFPIEVRCASADDVPLSTANGRETCYIAVHRYYRDDYRALFSHVEPILKAAGGRPHWGKLHTMSHEELREACVGIEEAARVREDVDPAGIFRNTEVDRVFGV